MPIFVSIHLPKSPETTGLVGKDLLAKAKLGIRIVNAARGAILDEEALADAIASGQVAGAALDVFSTEPCTSSPLFELDQVVVTPHLGASTAEAQDKAGEQIAEQIVLALRGELVPYAVNVAAPGATEAVRLFVGSRNDWAGCWRRCARRCLATSRSSTRATSQVEDTRILHALRARRGYSRPRSRSRSRT